MWRTTFVEQYFSPQKYYFMCLIFYSELMDHVFALYVNNKVLGHVLLFTVVALLSYVKFLPKSCAVYKVMFCRNSKSAIQLL